MMSPQDECILSNLWHHHYSSGDSSCALLDQSKRAMDHEKFEHECLRVVVVRLGVEGSRAK